MTIVINTEHNLILYSKDSDIKEVMLFITKIPSWEEYDIMETQVEGMLGEPSQSEEMGRKIIPSFQKGEA